MPDVMRQNWLESERGWGTRPDGYSLHINKVHRDQFIEEYNETLPKEVPDEYSRPEGKPFVISVDDETFAEVKKSKNGVRKF